MKIMLEIQLKSLTMGCMLCILKETGIYIFVQFALGFHIQLLIIKGFSVPGDKPTESLGLDLPHCPDSLVHIKAMVNWRNSAPFLLTVRNSAVLLAPFIQDFITAEIFESSVPWLSAVKYLNGITKEEIEPCFLTGKNYVNVQSMLSLTFMKGRPIYNNR